MVYPFEIKALAYLTPEQREQLKTKLKEELKKEDKNHSHAIAKEYLLKLFGEKV